MKTDVVVLTKNSERTLEDCLDSIYENVPVNSLIAVDGYSNDNTLGILRKFDQKYNNLTLIQDKGSRGRARQKGIEKVETEWFMFVDSDAILCDNWFEKAEKYMRDDVGAVWGIEKWSVIKNPKLLKLFEYVTMKIFESRGGTHDLLVRQEAVKDIRIPQNLHFYEDAYIKDWITKKGYKVIGTYDPYCIHRRDEEVWSMRSSVKIAANDIKHIFSKYPKAFPSYLFYIPISLYESLRMKLKKIRS